MAESVVNRIGKYEILGKLGDGATSAVYLAKDEFNDRQVAIKLVSQMALKDQNRGQRVSGFLCKRVSVNVVASGP